MELLAIALLDRGETSQIGEDSQGDLDSFISNSSSRFPARLLAK
jgi:hypothetical protein